MAEIATYLCSNLTCRLEMRLARDFPVWHNHTPRELRTPAVHPSARSYVARYRSESYCASCKTTVELTIEGTCAQCSSLVRSEHMGTLCPRCNVGTLSMPHLRVY